MKSNWKKVCKDSGANEKNNNLEHLLFRMEIPILRAQLLCNGSGCSSDAALILSNAFGDLSKMKMLGRYVDYG